MLIIYFIFLNKIMSDTNQAEILIAYPWITKDYFQEILQKIQNKNAVKVIELSANSALKKGENYGSNMLRVIVKYSTSNGTIQSWPFVIKAELANKEMQEMLEKGDVFRKEVMVYEQIVPTIERIFRNIGELSVQLVPR